MSCVVPSTAGTESVAKTMSLNLKHRKKSVSVEILTKTHIHLNREP